jgi:hypothetical protein
MTPDPRSAVERLAQWLSRYSEIDERSAARVADAMRPDEYADEYDRMRAASCQPVAKAILAALNLVTVPDALLARVRETRPRTDLEWDDESDDDNEGQHVVERGNQAEHEAALLALGRHVAEQLAAGRGVP